MLTVENLTFSYHRKKAPIFRDFSLSLPQRGVYGLLGENGAGKTTLIYMMMGLLTPQGGQVMLDGVNVRRRLPETMNKIYLVPEEYDLPPITLDRYVSLNAPFYPRFSEDDMKSYLGIFDMESDINLQELSMGQKKKVLMSFALATHTPLLLLDEPTNGLDIPSKSQFRKFIAQGMTEDQTILISTHQVRDVEQILENIIILGQSRVLLDEPSQRISEKLSFVESRDTELLAKAIYSQPTFNGNALLMPSEGDEPEDNIDLELLFNATLNHPERIENIFKADHKEALS
jgi:ABC-2 type transport system ATP-binding protein